MDAPSPAIAIAGGNEKPPVLESEHRRRERNRIAQRNYRKNIKNRLHELNVLRQQQGLTSKACADMVVSRPSPDCGTSAGTATPIPEARITKDARLSSASAPYWPENPTGSGAQPPPRSEFLDISTTSTSLRLEPGFDFPWPDTSSLDFQLIGDLGIGGTTSPDESVHHSRPLPGSAAISPATCIDSASGLSDGTIPGTTPLHQAAANGHTNIIKMLLRRGANLSTANKNGQSALHIATEHGHESVVRYLLEQGASVDARDHSGSTALHLAATRGFDGIVEALLCAGASVDPLAYAL